MARTKIQKSIHGKEVDDKVFAAEIVKLVRERGTTRPRDIAPFLGEEWETKEGKTIVAQTMGNMHKSKVLSHPQHGFYSIHPNYDQRAARTLEGSLVETIRRLGGLARARDILEDFDVRPAANKEVRSYGGRANSPATRIYAALKKSKHIIRYDLPREPRWGLPLNEMAMEPLTGDAARYLMRYGFLMAVERGKMEGGVAWERKVEEEIAHHYSQVGVAFAHARAVFGIEHTELAKFPPIQDCLEHMKRCAPHLVTRIFSDIKADARQKAKQVGKEDDLPYIERLQDADAEIFHAHILAYFEMGDPAAHRVAPADFYRAVANHLDVDAAALSRGTVIPMAHLKPLSEEWWSSPEAIAEFGEEAVNGFAHE